MKKPIFMALVGIQGVGKSTYAKQYAEECVVKVFSSDEYREKMYGSRKDQEHNDKVWGALYKDLREALENREDCILDATNVTVKSRLKCLEAIKGVDCVKIASVISCDVPTALKRNKNRKEEDQVPEESIKKYAKSFEVPMPWEGWDKIYFKGYDTDFCPRLNERCRELAMKQQNNFKQETPHHKYTLQGHAEHVAEQFGEDERVLRSAALFHDISKCVDEWNWTEKSEEGVRHYYNHDRLSALIMLENLEAFDCQTWDEVFETLFIISHHMDFRTWKESEKAMQKWTDRVGQKWMDDLARFVRADEIGSGNGDYGYHAEISKKIKEGYYVEHPEELIPEDYVEPEPEPEPEPVVEEAPAEIPAETSSEEVQEAPIEEAPIEGEVPPMPPMGGMGGLGAMMGMFGAMMGGMGGMMPPTGEAPQEDGEVTGEENVPNENPESDGMETQNNTESASEEKSEVKIEKIFEV